MDFDLNEEQRLLQESAGRLYGERYSFNHRRTFLRSPRGWSPDVWQTCAELGFLGIRIPVTQGGAGGGAIETMILMEAMGRAMALEPVLSSAITCVAGLQLGGTPGQCAAWFPRIADGSAIFTLAHSEAAARFMLTHVETQAVQDGPHWRINGEKTLVLNGDAATHLIISTRVRGGRADTDGIQLFVVDAGSPGITRRAYPLHDGTRAAEVTLVDVSCDDTARLGTAESGAALVEHMVQTAIAALAAEAVGAMHGALDVTVQYLKTRQQFGTVIGKFQALQHKAADMLIALEQARSMAMYAAMLADSPDADERRRGFSAVKAYIGEAGRLVGHTGVQLHGGVGLTDEFAISHYLKRLKSIGTLYGDADHHISALAAAGGLYNAA
jgi:alkylation response protein AidB-like acyl-CoA dehydrogenase